MKRCLNDRFRYCLRIFLITVICILVNYAGKAAAVKAELPLWLDSVGTAVCAYAYGPVCGAVVGFTANLMYGMKDSMVYVYAMVNLLTGVIIGLAGRKKMMETFFELSKVSALLTVSAVAVSTPMNLAFYDGQMGNVWGDSVVVFLKHRGIKDIPAALTGELFIDFSDKIITLTILFLLIKLVRFVREKKDDDSLKKSAGTLAALVCFVSASFLPLCQELKVNAQTAEKTDYGTYIQTVYNNTSGLDCGTANDIISTNDGVLWIGTYAGLYRYSGSDFRLMDRYESIKNVNDLYVDEEGRLWVGTNDMGISICSREEISNVLDIRNGLPSNSVRSIVRNSDGDYLVGTSDSLAVISLSGGISIKDVIDDIKYALSLSSDSEGHTAAVTSNGELHLLKGTDVSDRIKYDDEYFTSCRYNSDGSLYVTTDSNRIYVFDTSGDRLTVSEKITVIEFAQLNCTYEMEDGTVFFCADNGVGYLDKNNRTHAVSTGTFNSSVDNMTVDYQGNIWFCSSRQGLLKLCTSAFSELYSIAGVNEKVVNSVVEWHGRMYFGTDSGLDIIDKTTNVEIHENKLSEMFSGIRIRNLFVDSDDRMWICSYKGEVVRAEKDGTVTGFGEKDGITGTKFRQALELSDGTVAVASELGISAVKDDRVVYTVGSGEGLVNPIVLCMYQRQDGSVLAGTDGGGISVISGGKVTHTYSYEELGSGVVLRIVKDREDSGVFIVTSNGLCYMTPDNMITRFTEFPYSNNFDIYDNGQGDIFVTGSAGIFVADKKSLFSGGPVEYDSLNYIDGLRQTLTANSWNYVENDDIWYICNNSGVTKLDLGKYRKGVRSFRILVNSVLINGVSHTTDRSEPIVISGEDAVLELTPEIINYTSEDPVVRYYMEGYDTAASDVKQSELRSVEYRGLPAGKYKFNLAVLDENRKVSEKQVYTVIRTQELYEKKIFLVYFAVELIAVVAWIAWVITRMYMQKTLEEKKHEIDRIYEQVRLGNETILTIARTVDAKDENTSQHSFRVSEYSVMIGKKLGYDDEQCENLRKSALLHDIGKIGIPDSVLNKPGRLDDDEYEIMKSHVVRGGEILKNFTFIPHVQEGAMYHHERYDGKGYAYGLKGESIPEFARIIGVADAFDAMTANRVYRKKLDLEYVISELERGRGTQFDPDMADIMLGLIADGEINAEELYREEPDE